MCSHDNLPFSRTSSLIRKEMQLILLLSACLNIIFCEIGMLNLSEGFSWPSCCLSEW